MIMSAKEIFDKTFKFIHQHFGQDVFSGKTSGGTIRNEFVLYYFDGIAIAFASLIDKLVDHKVPSEIVEKVNEIKFSDELRSYKTGSVNGVKTRIKLFTEGVQDILDGR